MREEIRFLHDDRPTVVRDCAPTATVLDYLRAQPGLRGTKEGCAEGDCGACTVVIGEVGAQGMRYRAVNACILFLPVLDGKQLLTVEDLAPAGGELHPVQQAMVDEHGAQCGFCTPGFIMSLFGLYQDRPDDAIDRRRLQLGLAGNLCRCTGYAPIQRAAESALAPGREDRFLKAQADTAARLAALEADGPLAVRGGGGIFHAPRSLDELTALLAAEPGALLLAGATDVGLWVTKELRTFPVVIYTGEVAELRTITHDDEAGLLSIGAAVTYTDAMQPLCTAWPGFRPVLERLGGLQVRNMGTLGGNIANGSPIGDTPPGLIALGSRLVLNGPQGRRTVELEDFFIDYQQQDLREGEFLERILVPMPRPDAVSQTLFSTYKVSKRFEQDISALCSGIAIEIEAGRVRSARVAFGGMAATPRRAPACEAALAGREWNRATVEAAMAALADDYEPISDMRASSGYRRQVAANLLLRCFLESATDEPVRLESPHEPA